MTRLLDVLVPTYERPAALAVTLSGLAAQDAVEEICVHVADQSSDGSVWDEPVVAAALRVLRFRGADLQLHRNLPRRGLAQQRAFLLERSSAAYILYLDDDVWLDPRAVGWMLDAIRALRCGFVGMAVLGLSHLDDVRPHEQEPFEPWRGMVRPEVVRRGTRAWDRHRLHNAANLAHLADRVGACGSWSAYRVAWIGGCVLYESVALRDCGGFDFWDLLPTAHAGEDVVAQLLVMQRYGGAGLLPSLAYHQQLETTVPDRRTEAYDIVLEAAPETVR